MISPKEVRKLKRISVTTRVVRFKTGGKIIKAVSVADDVSKYLSVAAILKNHEPLWPPGACNAGMVAWVQCRSWYQISASK